MTRRRTLGVILLVASAAASAATWKWYPTTPSPPPLPRSELYLYIEESIILVTAGASCAIALWFMFRKSRSKVPRKSPTLTTLFLERLARQVAYGTLIIVVSLAASLWRGDLIAAGLCLGFAVLFGVHFMLTTHRIRSGVFGSNSTELLELITFIRSERRGGGIPPSTKVSTKRAPESLETSPIPQGAGVVR
jgi:hypothetical protein